MTTLKVMLNGRAESAPVMNWGSVSGKPLFGVGPGENPLELHLADGSFDRAPMTAALLMRLVGVAQRLIDAGGEVFAVHTFRYPVDVMDDGYWSWCGQCGRVCRMTFQELGTVGLAACRSCGAQVARSHCHRWHHWGRCEHCEPEPERELFAIERGANLPPKARPSASSQGPHLVCQASGRFGPGPGLDTVA